LSTHRYIVIGFLTCFLAVPNQGMALDNSFIGLYSSSLISYNKHVYVSAANQSGEIKQGAKNFISDMGEEAINFLSDDSLTQSQKESEFRDLLKANFDMKTIGRFALGKYWNLASPSEQQQYQRLFENMVVEVYAQRFNEYQGQDFEVRDARPSGKSDVIVNSLIVPDSGSDIQVDWRVRYKDGRYKIVDVIIEGVSMAVTQRSDFSSVIQRGGGNIQVLLTHLQNAQ